MSNLTPVMIWAATYFLHSSLLLGGVWCWFRWKEPRSHAFRETVWKLAAAGGFVTASMQLGMGIESPINTAMRTAWTAPSASAEVDSGATGSASALPVGIAANTGDPTDPPRFSYAQVEPEFDQAAPPNLLVYQPDEEPHATNLIAADLDEPSPAPAAASVVTSQPAVTAPQVASLNAQFVQGLSTSLVGLLAALGGAMVALSGWGLFRLVSEHSDFRRRLANCRIVSDGSSREILDDLLQQAHVRRPVTLLMSSDDLEPGACGWLRWQIVLPSRASEDLSPPELRALLAHELAHLVRGDQWWLLLGRLLVVCFGWQPLNRIALREWRRASEYLCDAWAVQRDVERISLARCLTTVAEWRLVGMATIAGLGSGNPSNLTQRVERLINDAPLSDPWQRYSRRHLLSAVSSVIAVGMVGYAPAATLSSPLPATSGEQVTAQAKMLGTESEEVTPQISDSLARHRVPLIDSQFDEQPGRFPVQLLSTRIDPPSIPHEPQLIIGIELIRAIQQQVSADMLELNAELQALEASISELPPLKNSAQWQSQLQRFQQRVANMRRLRDALLKPM